MKKRYLAIILLSFFSCLLSANALTIGDCKVLASYKQYSSLDEENYICKGKEYGNGTDAIYYSGKDNTIYLNSAEIYYFTNWEEYDVTLDISGKNSISMLRVSDSKFKVTGSGSLKFKQNSFVKKVINGESVYQYSYKGKTVLNSDKKIYEGMTLEFEEDYELLKEINNLPEKYNLEDYVLVQVMDFSKMTSVIVTESWIDDYIDTDLNTSLENGVAIIQYVKPAKEEASNAANEETSKKENQLETDNVIFISEEKVNKKYELKEEDLSDDELATKVTEKIDKDLVSLYDVSVYNGKKLVSMKDGKYTIKIKLDSNVDKYENYQIIYVNDDGEIEEYIDGVLEGDYIVFKTSHLSQYGVIASPVTEKLNENVLVTNTNKDYSILNHIFKISILVVFILGATFLIGVLVLKRRTLYTKRNRKRA